MFDRSETRTVVASVCRFFHKSVLVSGSLLELVDNYQNSDNYVVISYNNLFDVSATGTFVMNTIDW